MSTELEKIKEGVMDKIHEGKVKMKPKWYFVAGSVLTFFGLTLSIITSVFLMGLLRFALRSHGMMREYRLGEMITNFPWWTALLAIVFLVLGIWLIRKYDFSYKINPWYMIVGFIVSLVIAGWFIDMAGVNDTLSRRGPMRGVMKKYMVEKMVDKKELPKPMFRN